MGRLSFLPLAPFAIGVVIAALWLSIFPALSWLLPVTDAILGRIF